MNIHNNGQDALWTYQQKYIRKLSSIAIKQKRIPEELQYNDKQVILISKLDRWFGWSKSHLIDYSKTRRLRKLSHMVTI